MPTAQGRRYSRSTAPRPDIALIVECTIACAHAATAFLQPDVDLSPAQLAARASAALEHARGERVRQAVVATLTDVALAHVDDTYRRLAADLGLPADTAPQPSATEAITHAARHLTLPNDPAGLGTHPAPAAAQVLALGRVAATHAALARGDLNRLLTTQWQAVERDHTPTPGALDDAIARHTAAGIDAEQIAWAAIISETHNHVGLIVHEAKKLAPRYREVVATDVLGFGWQGLRAALRSYDPTVAAFSTYACPRINGAIRDGLRAEQPIPKRLTTLVNKVARAEEALTHALGRAPELAELAERIGVELDKLHLLPRLDDPASIDEITSSERAGRPGAVVDDADGPDVDAIDLLRCDAVEAALRRLPDDEATAVRLQLLDGMTAGDTAAEMGLTTRQLRTVRNRALASLEPLLAEWNPAR